MSYAVDVLRAALVALERIGVNDQRVYELRAAIEKAEKPWVKTCAGGWPNFTMSEEPRTSIGALLKD